jgi:AAA domain/Bifunctional DNA primase/polymerase, N-terminal
MKSKKKAEQADEQPHSKLQIALDALECPAVAGVFPVGEDKLPMSGSHGYLDATDDVGEVIALWNDYPEANVAVWLGPEYVVFDCDQKGGKDGLGELAHFLEMRKDDLLMETFTNGTPSGGFHLIFKTDVPWGQRNGILPGVDTRGVQGYILWPGDEFVDPKTGEVKEYVRYFNGEDGFAALPRKLLKLHNPVQRKREDERSLVEEPDAEEHQQEFIDYLDENEEEWDADGRFEEGLRNDTVAWLGALGHDFGLSEDTTVDIAAPWYEERVDCDFDVDRHMRSGYRSAKGVHGCLTTEGIQTLRKEEIEQVLDAFGTLSAPQIDVVESGTVKRSDKQARLIGGFEIFDHPGTEELIEGLFRTTGTGSVSGRRNSGKTVVTVNALLHAAHDMEFYGRRIAEGFAVVVWAGEDPNLTAEYIEAWCREQGIVEPDPERFCYVREVPNVMDKEELAEWAEAIRAKFPNRRVAVFVDTFARATAGAKRISNEEMDIAIKNAEEVFCDILNGPVIFAQHPPKGTNLMGEQDAVFGATALQDAAFFTLLVRQENGVITVGHEDKQGNVTGRVRGRAKGTSLQFKFRPVELPGRTNQWGEPKSSITLELHAPLSADTKGEPDSVIADAERHWYFSEAVPVIEERISFHKKNHWGPLSTNKIAEFAEKRKKFTGLKGEVMKVSAIRNRLSRCYNALGPTRLTKDRWLACKSTSQGNIWYRTKKRPEQAMVDEE